MKLLEKTKLGVYVIAEMSANHNGDFKRALELARIAKDCVADCLRIQTYTADSITIDCDKEYFIVRGGLWDGYKLYDLYKEAATPYEWQADIKNECEKIGLDFLSTPFDAEGADFLESIGVGAYKIASFELVDIPLVRHIAKKGKPMIVSCGMGSSDEIQDAVDAMVAEGLDKDKIILLKCTSEYPATVADMNLQTIKDMGERFGVMVGLSDHSMSVVPPVVAVSMGARVIEKHFCESRNLGGVDSGFSLEPHEFREMVDSVRQAYDAIGTVNYAPSNKEKSSLQYRRSIFAVQDIKKGDALTAGNIRVIRPGQGAKPKHYAGFLGTLSPMDIERGEPFLTDRTHIES